MPNIISVRERPQYSKQAIAYFQSKWATPDSMMVYEDCITSCLNAPAPLPQWYLLMEGERIIGGAGLITNDFISREDLYPWICAVYVEEDCRGNAYSSQLLQKAKEDAKKFGFSHVYLSTDLEGFYEKYGFHYLGIGYHPWGESSRIYEADV